MHLPDAVWRLRDRLLADPRWLRLAVRFPLSRAVARRRAAALFDLCAGFVYAQVLAACVELRLFDMLRDGPLPAEVIVRRAGLSAAPAQTLLRAAAALRLLARRRGGFGLGPLGAAMLGNPGVGAMVAHHAMLYADLADPVALLRAPPGATRLARFWAYGATGAAGAYSALMAASQAMIAAEVLDAVDLRRYRRLLDVGGGDGSFLRAVAARVPGLRLALFDLPEVAALAEARLAESGVAAEVFGGDMRAALPGGADLISLLRVIHDHDEPAALAILRTARAALPPGGTLLLGEPMAGTRGAEASGDAYFGLYLLAMGQGRPRRRDELTALLQQAGFTAIREAPTHQPLLVRVLLCK